MDNEQNEEPAKVLTENSPGPGVKTVNFSQKNPRESVDQTLTNRWIREDKRAMPSG
jgi:hypothetical protein